MKTFSILLKTNNRVDVKASNITRAYKKLCDISNYNTQVTNMFLRYDKDGYCNEGFIITKESINAVEKYGKVENNNVEDSINTLYCVSK